MINILLNSFAFGSTQDILIIAVLVLVLFGGSKIPQLMRGVGQGLGEFKEGLEDSKKKLQDAMDSSSKPSVPRPAEVPPEESETPRSSVS